MRGAPRAQPPRTRVIPVLAICVALCAAARADDADLGREVYDDFCVTCHGRDMVNPGGVTFDLRKFPKDAAERFVGSVLNGKGNGMPPWRDKLSDDPLNPRYITSERGIGYRFVQPLDEPQTT